MLKTSVRLLASRSPFGVAVREQLAELKAIESLAARALNFGRQRCVGRDGVLELYRHDRR
jgi:hypothetical protein